MLLATPSDLSALDALIHQVEQRLPGVGGALVATGLFAAGCSSALAAPIAAGWAVCGALGLSTDETGPAFKSVSLVVLVIGAGLALLASRPQALIVTAQAANAMLLPLVAIILLLIANSKLVPDRLEEQQIDQSACGRNYRAGDHISRSETQSATSGLGGLVKVNSGNAGVSPQRRLRSHPTRVSRYSKMSSMALIDAKLILCTPFAAVHLGSSRYETTQTIADSNATHPAIRAHLP